MVTWRNQSPGDLSVELPEVHATPVEPAVERTVAAAGDWAATPIDRRIERLRACRAALESAKAELAMAIAAEVGKPLKECVGELGAVIAKFDLTFADADRWLRDEPVTDGPHPAMVRHRPRGPAAILGPFNFPIHLPHGQIVPHLLAGNTVLFKPSPVAANVCARYAALMAENLPPGVFGLVQGGADEGRAMCVHPAVRSIGFTGSVPAGKAIARAIAGDLSKDAALELGGKCAAIVCEDADLDRAAAMCAEAACLTAGQRCNATSRIIVDAKVQSAFLEKLLPALHAFTPGDPTKETTRLGPLVTAASLRRYQQLIDTDHAGGYWLKRGHVPASVEGKVGHYVEPAAILFEGRDAAQSARELTCDEAFAPILSIIAIAGGAQALVEMHNSTPFGLTASVFTRSKPGFEQFADRLNVGNVYANLPTTFSPSTLPFGGWGDSGNGRPGGRGFLRFASAEQAVQWSNDGFAG